MLYLHTDTCLFMVGQFTGIVLLFRKKWIGFSLTRERSSLSPDMFLFLQLWTNYYGGN